VLRRAGLDVRRQRAEGLDVLEVAGREPVGKRLDRLAVRQGRRVDLVLDVRDVAHVRDLVVKHAEQPHEHVEGDGGQAVADVDEVVGAIDTDLLSQAD